MQGMEEFKLIFGGITLWQVVELGLALGFALALYKKVKNYILERHDAEQERDEKLAQALDSINRYPQYRAQSLKIQDELRGEIAELRSTQQQTAQRLLEMEESQRMLERNNSGTVCCRGTGTILHKANGPLWKRKHFGSFSGITKAEAEMAICTV